MTRIENTNTEEFVVTKTENTNTEENNFSVKKKKKTLVKPLPTLKCSNQVQANKSVVRNQM